MATDDPWVMADTALVQTVFWLTDTYTQPAIFTRIELAQALLRAMVAGMNLMYASPEWAIAALHEAGPEVWQKFIDSLDANRAWIAKHPLGTSDRATDENDGGR